MSKFDALELARCSLINLANLAKMVPGLKDHPFCGNSARLILCAAFGDNGWSVSCNKCDCRLDCDLTREEAIKLWNRRYTTDGDVTNEGVIP